MDVLVEDHPPPRIACSYRKCKASFSRKTDAHRHEKQVHQLAKIFCNFAGCRFRGTVRAEVLRRHLKSKHFFEVQSTFQIDNDNFEGGLRKVEIPRETSAGRRKVESSSRWSFRLIPNTIAESTNMPHVAGHKIDTYVEMGCHMESETSRSLYKPDQKTWEISDSEYVLGNQQSRDISHISESEVPMNMASCSFFPLHCDDASALDSNCWGSSTF